MLSFLFIAVSWDGFSEGFSESSARSGRGGSRSGRVSSSRSCVRLRGLTLSLMAKLKTLITQHSREVSRNGAVGVVLADRRRDNLFLRSHT